MHIVINIIGESLGTDFVQIRVSAPIKKSCPAALVAMNYAKPTTGLAKPEIFEACVRFNFPNGFKKIFIGAVWRRIV